MKTVLFACVHNAGRSQMAAAWFNTLADEDQARAESAGTEPAAAIHPEVVVAMREVGLKLEGIVPRKLTNELARGVSLLVTMGCGETCPVVPGLRRVDWPLEDPKGGPLERVRRVRDETKRRVAALLVDEGWDQKRGDVEVRAPASDDLARVEELLERARLPTAGLSDQFPDGYVVAMRDGKLLGCAGLEVYERVGLLRSVVAVTRHQGIGRTLVANRLAAARAAHLGAVYLLTTTASDYFSRLGFRTADRTAAPATLARSIEFKEACPASASCMVFALDDETRNQTHP